ncbi:MAG: diguanylate cyclase [Magnetococcus sp. WYHC-3]
MKPPVSAVVPAAAPDPGGLWEHLFQHLGDDPALFLGVVDLLRHWLGRGLGSGVPELPLARRVVHQLFTIAVIPRVDRDATFVLEAESLAREVGSLPPPDRKRLEAMLLQVNRRLLELYERFPRQEPAPERLPFHLLGALRALGSEEPWIVEAATRLQGGFRGQREEWEELETLLEKIIRHDQVTQAFWRREREVLKGTLADVAGGFESTLRGLGGTGGHLADLAERIRQSDNLAAISQLRQELLRQVDSVQEQVGDLRQTVSRQKELLDKAREQMRRLDGALKEARDGSLTDATTQLPNRFALSAHFTRQLQRASHLRGTFSLSLIRFHDYQRQVGDLSEEDRTRLIQAFAKRVKRTLSPRDTLFQLAADILVVMWPDQDEAQARASTEVLMHAMDNTCFRIGQRSLVLRAGVGVAGFRPGMTEADMMHQVEYRALLALESVERQSVLYSVSAPPASPSPP